MKKTILLVMLLPALYICWKSSEPLPQKPGSNWPHPSDFSAQTTIGPERKPSPPEDAEALREELAQLDHEIARAGYPEVMMDERLREDEREELISKVLRSTKLFNRILQLRVAGYRKGQQ